MLSVLLQCRLKPYKRKYVVFPQRRFVRPFRSLLFCSMTSDLDRVLDLDGDSVFLSGDCNVYNFVGV